MDPDIGTLLNSWSMQNQQKFFIILYQLKTQGVYWSWTSQVNESYFLHLPGNWLKVKTPVLSWERVFRNA